MARLKDPTRFLCELEALNFTSYDKGILLDVQERLEFLLKDVNKAINQYDYNKEVKELKKKYNIE